MQSLTTKILEGPWKSIKLTPENLEDLRTTVPRQPGLYAIYTTAPKNELRKFGARKEKKHYNLKKKIAESELLPQELIIHQKENKSYCVYNGHTYNLRQRMSEHFKGSKGTGCLALFQLEPLRKYDWTFKYLDLTEVDGYEDSKIYRTLLEQHLRIKKGWPILCSQ